MKIKNNDIYLAHKNVAQLLVLTLLIRVLEGLRYPTYIRTRSETPSCK